MSSSAERNISIDAGRFLCAFLVVCLHTRFPVPYFGALIGDVGKVAVPFFLMVSGYYLYSDDKYLVYVRALRSIKKLLKIIFFTSVVYGLLRVLKVSYFGIDLSAQDYKFVPFILFNDFNFTEHLWYLFAYLYVLIIAVILSGRLVGENCPFATKLGVGIVSHKLLLYVVPQLIVVNIVFTLWSRFVPISDGKFWYELNWFVVALPFVSIGMLLCKSNSMLKLLNRRSMVFMAFTLLVLVFSEHLAFKQFVGKGPGVVSICFFSIICFAYCSQNYRIFSTKIDTVLAGLGKKHALNIYLYHVLVRELLSLMGFNGWLNNSFSVFFLSFLVSCLVEKIFNKQ